MRVSIWAIALICPTLGVPGLAGRLPVELGSRVSGILLPERRRGNHAWRSLLDGVAYRTGVPRLHAGAAAKRANVRSWVYQLSGYQNNRLDQIAGSSFDLAVVDLARDGGGDYFTPGEVAALTSRGKVALAYFEIGAIEDYRPEWSQVPADLKLGPVQLRRSVLYSTGHAKSTDLRSNID